MTHPGLSVHASPTKPRIMAMATLDSKGHEIAYVAEALRDLGIEVKIADVSLRGEPQIRHDYSREEVAACHPHGRDAVFAASSREAGMAAMGEAMAKLIERELQASDLRGAIGMGGSEGSSLIAPALRRIPLGLPKLLISTLASGDTRPYVDIADMTLQFPVTDLAGLNFVSRQILRNAAAALAGMVQVAKTVKPTAPSVGMTMFGVTTLCVDRVREGLGRIGYEGVVFHAVGTGGAAMERLASEGAFQGLIDLTTTEVADALAGGIFPATPDRFEGVAKHHLPAVMSVGALDMVNFGSRDSVPGPYRLRNLYAHTPLITLMRTSMTENVAAGRFIAERINPGQGPLILLLPEGGISALDAPGQPFYDPDADAALFRALETQVKQTAHRVVRRVPWHINDPRFAAAALAAFAEVMAWAEKEQAS